MLLLSWLGVAWGAPLDPAVHDVIAPTFAPSGAVVIDTSADPPTLYDDASGATLLGTRAGVVAVFTFDDVDIQASATVEVEGTRPLALLARNRMTIAGEIDVAADGRPAGPGGFDGATCGNGHGVGGGEGSGSGAGGGGFGGAGGDSDAGVDGGLPYGNLLLVLEGGSGGGSEVFGPGCANPHGGGGGGAIELGAGRQLDIADTAEIRADGAPGEPAATQGREGDGAGGGAGGGILVHSYGGGTCEGTLSARGGAGGLGIDTSRLDGGGGGGGRVVILGVDTTDCTIELAGGSGQWTGLGPSEDGAQGVLDVFDPDDDGDGVTVLDGDCDDRDDAVYAGADEVQCDGIDQDCDDADLVEDADRDGYTTCDDCDDGDARVHPGQGEVPCNGIADDDCDPGTPDVVDGDGDGSDCEQDCDDSDAEVRPGIPETPCNDKDDDCSGSTPDAVDLDLDGFTCPADCDDDDDMVYPGAMEQACNGLDDDCSSTTADDPPDGDGDGWSLCQGDCDDGNQGRSPALEEVRCNGLDDDCDDGTLDDDGQDRDGDGSAGCADCDDQDEAVHPGAVEIPGDGVDNDCDGVDLPAGTPPDSGTPGGDTGATPDGGTAPEDRQPAEIEAGSASGAAGCGCATGGAPPGWLLLLAAGGFRARRRCRQAS